MECPVQQSCPSSIITKKKQVKVKTEQASIVDHGIKMETTQTNNELKEERSVYFTKPKQEEDTVVKKENLDW